MPTREAPVAFAIGVDVYEFDKATPHRITLVHRVTQERRTFTPAELAQVLTSETDATTSPRVFDTLPKHVIEAATLLAGDIEEVLTGVGRNNRRRPEYDIVSTSQEQRVARKLNEMAEDGRGMARSSFFRKLDAYRKHGLVGLVDGRALREFPLLIDKKALAVFITVISSQLNESTGTLSRIIKESIELTQAQYPDAKIPSRASYYTLAKVYGVGKHATGSAKTRRSLGNRPDRTFGMTVPTFPGEVVEIDTNTMDVEVRTPKGDRKRPRLSLMIDVYTRSILAFTIRLEATKSVDHTLLLAQAATPRATRPSRQWLRDELQQRNRKLRLLPAEEYDTHSQAMPFIFPRSVTTDRGSDYMGASFHAAVGKLQGSIVLAPPHTPTGKPHVERMFSTINSLFTQHLPGYIGRSPEHRGKQVELDKLLTVEELRELFEDWVIQVWQNRPHAGLRDPLHPSRHMTPNTMAERASLTAAQFRVPLTREDYILMLDSPLRTIGSTGVRYAGRDYDSEELHPLRHQKSDIPRHGGKWEVKVDPYNPACVWVVGPQGRLIECHERGAEARIYEPDFPAIEDDYRALTARADAELTGTPFPEPAAPPLPEHVANEPDDDEGDDYIPNF